MLTRFVRTQLIIFTIASIVGVAIMLFAYIQVPTLLGLGRLTVKLDLPATGGLYQFSNVTYRGLQIGKVTSIDLTDNGAQATLSLDTSPKIPADLKAEVRSMSAVGEQYVELLPRNDKAPYLQDGSVIAVGNTSIPQSVGPMLDQVSKLMDTIPKEKLSQLLGESYQAFNGTGYDFGSLIDSGSTITRDANGISDNTRALIDDARPFLGAQEMTTDSIRTWAASLAGVTEQVANNDPQFRSILRNGPGFAQETSKLLEQIKPTLPVLLANLTTFGQIGLTYNKSIEQLLVLVPPFVAQIQTYAPTNNPTGLPNGDFSLGLGDPAACTVGFLPPSSWRNPADTSVIDTPDNLYCKLPQDSPVAVRGARNYPCMEHPGKRAPTVELCNDPNGFQPLAQRQHVTRARTRSIRGWLPRAFRSIAERCRIPTSLDRCRARRCHPGWRAATGCTAGGLAAAEFRGHRSRAAAARPAHLSDAAGDAAGSGGQYRPGADQLAGAGEHAAG